MLKYILTFICLVLVTAQLVAAQDVPPSPDYTGPKPVTTESKVRGRVIYEDNGKPVRHGTLVLLQAANLQEVYKSRTLTDADGRFVMKEILAGSYYPSIEVAGILNPMSYRGFSGVGSPFEARSSSRKLEAFFKKIVIDGVNDAEVIILAKRAGAIAGRVTYFDGDAAPGVRVEAMRKSADGYERSGKIPGMSGASAGVTYTDDRGSYRFSGLPPGEYLVYIQEKAVHVSGSNRGYPYASGSDNESSDLRIYYPDTQSSKDAKPVEVLIGSQLEGVDITIPDRKLYKISGTVVSKSDKKPLGNFRVSFERIGAGEKLNMTYRSPQTLDTDPEGKWVISDLPSGKYRLEFSPQYQYDPPAQKPGEKRAPRIGRTFLEIDIEDASREGLIIEIPFASIISGTVAVEGGKTLPQSIYVLSIQKGKSNTAGFALVSREGETKRSEFRIENATPGDNNLFVYFEGSEPFYVKSIRSGSIDLASSTLPVKESEETTGVEIVLSDKTGILKGKVIGQEGSFDFPRILAVPVGRPEGETFYRVRSPMPNEDGEFEFSLAPGEYFVTLHKGGTEEEPFDDWYKRQTEGAVKVTITERETTKVTLKLPEK